MTGNPIFYKLVTNHMFKLYYSNISNFFIDYLKNHLLILIK